MLMNRATIEADATSRFVLDRLRIAPELAGATHDFDYEGYRTIVTLPKPKVIPTPDTPVSQRDERIECDHWISKGMIPVNYRVNSLDFEIQLPDQFHIPSDLLRLPAK